MMETLRLESVRVVLALHRRSHREGPPLLLLHGRGGSSADWPADVADWPGPVWALDFSGHGASERLPGGGYSPEVFAADADRALAELGPSHLLGRGLGAYVALLLAGARPEAVPGALLLPGPGLHGRAAEPDAIDACRRFEEELAVLRGEADAVGPDPLTEFDGIDVRPPAYARAFAERAKRLVLARNGDEAPPWWREVLASPRASEIAADSGPLALAARHLFEVESPFESAGRALARPSGSS